MLKIGFVGLDTSHVVAFTDLLNNPKNENHIDGARVTVAWPGGSPDFDLSFTRVEGYTKTLREEHGVTIVDSPEAVAEACDLLFIESVDGRVHLEQFKRTVSFRKPTFIDKPFAVKLADAREMVRLAKQSGTTLMSGSSLRFSEKLHEALSAGRADIRGCSVFGPAKEVPSQPGLFWYGCHSVEMMVAAMGPGCREVRCLRTEQHDLMTAVWNDGRVASLQGLRDVHGNFGITLHRTTGPQVIDPHAGKPFYVGLLRAILESLPKGRSAIAAAEMLEIVAIIEAANCSRANDGTPVAVETV